VLTPYKFLRLVFVGVSTSANTGDILVDSVTVAVISSSVNTFRGIMDINLTDGAFAANLASSNANSSAVGAPYVGDIGIINASTSITVARTNGNFDAGSVRVYGMK
jgi:hypothetical protein